MLPPKVRERHGSYFYRHQGKEIKLSRVREGATALFTALQAYTADRPATYGQLMNIYIARGMEHLSPETKPEYIRIIHICLQHAFGHMPIGMLKPTHVAQYLEKRKKENAAIGGNRERAVLGAIIAFGMRHGWCEDNPCRGRQVARNTERPSRVYVTDDHLQGVLDRAPPSIRNLLAVAYLTGLRQTDLLRMKKSAVTQEGLKLEQSKDGKLRLITWSPKLWGFIEDALAVPADENAGKKIEAIGRFRAGERVAAIAASIGIKEQTIYWWLKNPDHISRAQVRRAETDYVFVGPSGRPFTKHGIQSAMKRLNPGFAFRHLRPKAASDAEHNVLGHDAQMLRTYVRAQRIAPVR